MKKLVAVLMIPCVFAVVVSCTTSSAGELILDPASEGIVRPILTNLAILLASPFILLALFGATFTLAGQALATLN